MIICADSAAPFPLADRSVQCVVTSPPYWGLRDYGDDRQLGLEATPEEYVSNLVGVFHEVWRVLRDDGTLWLNLGDSYISSATGGGTAQASTLGGGKKNQIEARKRPDKRAQGYKDKDLVGIPWMVAFALRSEGWWLRSDIIWHKPNPMPGSYMDRPTVSKEYLFLLSKSRRYHYDHEAIKEPAQDHGQRNREKWVAREKAAERGHRPHMGGQKCDFAATGRNKRDVWTISTTPSGEEHFAAYPEELVEPCVLAGCPVGGLVLDPFCGTGTTIRVAQRLGRRGIGMDCDMKSCLIAKRRTAQMSLC